MDYTELKRLAEAAKDRQLGTLTIPVDVVLSNLAEIERYRCGTEVLQRLHDEDMAERNNLRTQNQALLEALKTLYVKLTPQVNGADEHCYLIGMRKQVSHAEMIKVVEAIKLAEGKDV